MSILGGIDSGGKVDGGCCGGERVGFGPVRPLPNCLPLCSLRECTHTHTQREREERGREREREMEMSPRIHHHPH